MQIIKMVEDMDGPGELIYGPAIPFNFEGEKNMDPYKAGKLIDELVTEYLYDHPEVPYQVALHKVLDKNPDLKAAYTLGVFFPSHDQPINPEKLPDGNPKRPMSFYIEDTEDGGVRTEVDRRVRKYMEKNTALDYKAALEEVFSLDPDLKERYSKS